MASLGRGVLETVSAYESDVGPPKGGGKVPVAARSSQVVEVSDRCLAVYGMTKVLTQVLCVFLRGQQLETGLRPTPRLTEGARESLVAGPPILGSVSERK